MLGSTYPMVDDFIKAGSSLHIGQEYYVYGILITDGIPLIMVDLGDIRWSFEPLILFEISDPSVSPYWQIHINTEGDIEIYPAEFFEHPYLLDDVSENDEHAINIFRIVQAKVRNEFN
jgi:hypothetical protein